jgi:hypothetical protein
VENQTTPNLGPKVVLCSVTGPGVYVPGAEKYLYVVYSFPPYMHLSLEDYKPPLTEQDLKAMQAKVQKLLEGEVKETYLVEDIEFIEELWTGTPWPLMTLYSPALEIFSEGGRLLTTYRKQFLSKDTLEKWIGYCPKRKHTFDELLFPIFVQESIGKEPIYEEVVRAVRDLKTIAQDLKNVKKLYRSVKEVYEARREEVPDKISRNQLSEFLISLRLLI